MTTLTHLECSRCGTRVSSSEPRQVCACGGPLLARYDLETARQSWNREWIKSGPSSIWRYAPILPVSQPAAIVSLGEGMTPLIHARRLGEKLNTPNLWVKEEGQNPTASFKARSISCALSMVSELGIREVAAATQGNAGGALAAYAAAAGLTARLFMPSDVPQANYLECRAFGAEVTPVNGLIGECRRLAAEACSANGWFDLSTLREPYGLEGSKTMGYELAEQFNWRFPDAIVYPTGSGIGLIALWKAFDELEQLGWTVGKRPKLIAVQAAGCQPIVEAFHAGKDESEAWPNASTFASGLRVPKSPGDFLLLRILRESGGTALAVEDRELLDAALQLASMEGIFPGPEGAACVAALPKLLSGGVLNPDDRIVLWNTASGLKYPEVYSTRFPRLSLSEQDKLGGLITPR